MSHAQSGPSESPAVQSGVQTQGSETDEGFSVSCPGLPGCWSQGQTEDEALANIEEAIREYLVVRDELLNEGVVREVQVGR
ncbi:MAG: type II toxin-antitoxin system HicB family antitoxin [Gemmatimonadetes bacterium]|nr:type II toxin-antitoxin system HicB family antitoxin [Gemmatimonadota bacterium]